MPNQIPTSSPTTPEPEEQKLRRQLQETQDKLARLQRVRTANIKISEKGAVSLYGLGKFPVTLYADQWRMLLDQGELIELFLAENVVKLARK